MNAAYLNQFDSVINGFFSNKETTPDDIDNQFWIFRDAIAGALKEGDDYIFEHATKDKKDFWEKELWDNARIQHKDVFSHSEEQLIETTLVISHSLRGKQQDKIILRAIDALADKYAQVELDAMNAA